MLKSEQIDVSTPSGKSQWLVLFACLLLIVLIPVLCFSSDGEQNGFFTRGGLFWLHIVWFECIFLSMWYGSTGKHVSNLINKSQQTGGANVAIVYLWNKLAFLSFLIWGVSIFMPEQSSWHRALFLIQAVIAVVYGLLIYATPVTKAFQMQGMDLMPGDLPSPGQLADLLNAKNLQGYPSETVDKIKKISEKIRYSIPQVGIISSSQNYREIVQKIAEINPSLDNGSLLQILDDITSRLNQIVMECKH